MKAREFSVDLMKLKEGVYDFEFDLEESFFTAYESSPITSCTLKSTIRLEKRADHIDMIVTTKGLVDTDCDRCTADIKLPVEGKEEWFFRKSDEDNDPQIEILEVGQTELDLARYIYESAVMAMPAVHVYDCDAVDSPPCNMVVLDRLQSSEPEPDVEGSTDVWDALTKLDIE